LDHDLRSELHRVMNATISDCMTINDQHIDNWDIPKYSGLHIKYET